MDNEYDELYHHGILGQKWGIRRYQNYDGSYTKRGLERYRKAQSSYEDAKTKAQQTKTAYKAGTATRKEYADSKKAVKTEKKKMNSAYDQLALDKKADEGKKLYKSGKTITNNTKTQSIAEAVIAVGSLAARQVLSTTLKDENVANITAATIAIGASAVNAAVGLKTESENKKLRAYYAH